MFCLLSGPEPEPDPGPDPELEPGLERCMRNYRGQAFAGQLRSPIGARSRCPSLQLRLWNAASAA